MAWTTEQLEKLEAAIAIGALTVKYQDREVTYRSISEMLRVRDMIRKDLGLVSNQNTRVLAKYDKGLY